jgi:hypothetical protein
MTVAMARIFGVAAALFAVVAAVFWLLSAYGELPQITSVGDLLFAALSGAAIMTSWAAGLSGASAVCAAVRFLL